MSGTETTQDTIATALREGLLDVTLLEPEGTREDIVSALIPVVEKLLAEQDKGWASWWAFVFETGIPGSVVLDQFTREELRSHISERWDGLEARAAEAERRIREIAALKPRIVESLTNDTLIDDPLAEPDEMPCECEDCGRLRIDALRSVLALLDTGAGQGEKT